MEWTETLCRETGIRFLTTRPSEIEAASFAIIKEELGQEFLKACPQDQLPVFCRVIHTTADFSYKESLYFSEDAVSKGREALASGIPIITDTTMAASGINKTAAAAHGVQVRCFIGDEDVKEAARESGITRSAVSVDKAARLYPDCIYAVGNAPTALMRLYEKMHRGDPSPSGGGGAGGLCKRGGGQGADPIRRSAMYRGQREKGRQQRGRRHLQRPSIRSEGLRQKSRDRKSS